MLPGERSGLESLYLHSLDLKAEEQNLYMVIF